MENEGLFGISRKEIQWFPTIDYSKCVGCMACLNKCPNKVYVEKEGMPKVANPFNCVVGCTGCQKVCPQNAISHPPKEYLENLSKIKNFKIRCSECCSSGCECGCD